MLSLVEHELIFIVSGPGTECGSNVVYEYYERSLIYNIPTLVSFPQVCTLFKYHYHAWQPSTGTSAEVLSKWL